MAEHDLETAGLSHISLGVTPAESGFLTAEAVRNDKNPFIPLW
jgi:hypothetical protein